MGTIITAATILATYLSSTADINSQYCYNADIENGQIKTMYVFDKDGQALSGKLEYRYTYDRLGRLTAKETLRRDARTGRMTPESLLTYTYSADGYTLEHSLWNASAGIYGSADSRTEYRYETAGVISVTSYELAADGSISSVKDNILVMLPVDGELMAEQM